MSFWKYCWLPSNFWAWTFSPIVSWTDTKHSKLFYNTPRVQNIFNMCWYLPFTLLINTTNVNIHFAQNYFSEDLSWSKMNPELFQSLVLFVYSVIFFSIALIMWRKKRKRSHALENLFPCATYLRMRFETARILDTKEHSQSRIGALRFAIR